MYLKLLFLFIFFVVSHEKAIATPTATAPSAAALYAWCDAVTLAIPQIKRKPCIDAQLQPVATRSIKGREIMLREFKPVQPPAARVLVIGGIHGDELTSVSIVFRWLELMVQPSHDNGPYHWRIVPVLNPDGLLAKPPTRVNARGVDLNRNFPTHNWLREAPRYWETKTKRDPRRYPGATPASEPESRWLHDEIAQFKPDVIVSIHAPYGVLDFDGPVTGVEAPTRFGRLHLNRVGVFPGSLGNFGGLKEGIPVVTLELPHALKMPTEIELTQVWQDMHKWMLANLVDRKAAVAATPAATTVEPRPLPVVLQVPAPRQSSMPR